MENIENIGTDEIDFEALKEQRDREREEIDLLIEKGFLIKTRITSIFKFGRKYRTWKVSFLPLGLMDYQTDLFFKLDIDENKIYSGNAAVRNDEFINGVKANAKICAEILAISVLGSPLKIKLFRKILANYFLWRVNSKELIEFTLKLYKANDYQNFISSIVLLQAKRTTTPISEEKTKAKTIELNQHTD